MLALSILPFGVGVFLFAAPVENPGVQDCGAPLAFTLTGRTNTPVRAGDSSETVDLEAQRAQTPCNDLVHRRFVQGVWSFAIFLVLATTGAVLGLVDYRMQLRRAPRFEDLLRERPDDAPGSVWDQPIVPPDDIGEVLPEVESIDVDAFVVWSAGTVVVLLVVTGVRPLLDVVTDLRVLPLLVVVASAAVARVVAGVELASITGEQAGQAGRVVQTTKVMVASDWIARLRPAFGATGVHAHYLARSGIPRDRVLVDVGMLVTVAALVHAVVLGVLFIAAVVVGSDDGSWPPYEFALLLGLVLMGIAGLVMLSARLRRLPCRLGRDTMRRLRETWQRAPVDVTRLAAVAAALPLLHGVVVFASAAAFGGSAPVPTVLFVVTLALAFGALAPVPDGLLAADAALVIGLSLAGVGAVAAVAAVLSWRVFMTWLPMLPGLFVTRRLRAAGTL